MSISLSDLNIQSYNFPSTQYIAEEHKKKQIYLHHTASSENPVRVWDYWKTTPDRVATCVVIGGKTGKFNNNKDGQIVQGFSSKHFGYHLGLQTSTFKKFNVPYQSLDKISIGIEICNWGWVTETDKGWETYAGTTIPEDMVVEYSTPFKGRRHYQKYTDAQIESTEKLLKYWNQVYGIPLTYNDDIWDITPRALKGDPGVYTHNSVRSDKSDIHPQKEMIEMLKSL